ncbi:MAG: LysR family transcriptional regulator [Bryobacteraceae bacterium]
MTLTQLECFLAVAKALHFGRAAQELGKTAPALSVQMQRLESSLGVTLFDRAGRGVVLTGAAELLIPHAERVLAEAREATSRMTAVRSGKRGLIRIGVLPTVAAHFLPHILQRFRATHPETVVLLREEGQTPHLHPLLESNEIELALCRGPFRIESLKAIPLLTEEYCLGVSRNHWLYGKEKVSVSELQGERFVVYKSPGHANRLVLFEMCNKVGFEPTIAFESEQAETMQYLVAANLGITVLPEMVLRHGADKGVWMIRLQAPTLRRTIVATWKAGRYLSPFARAFVACARQAGKSWPG